MKQEPASKNKDGTIIQFPSFENRKQTKGLMLFPIVSGILCAAIFGLILNLLLEKPEQQPLLAEPPEETSLFEVPAFTFWVLQAGAFSTEAGADDFISTLSSETPYVLVKQDDMHLLWIGAAGTEEKAKALAAAHTGDVYLKQIGVEAFQLDLSEKEWEWLSAIIGAIHQKLTSPGSAFTATSGELENNDLETLQKVIKNSSGETAFLQSLGAILQLEKNSSE
ncbi:SPOR domain-containing protein [Jeotgalibacillus sp. JSM ZJ347]|uniref:SPOR domain-containing protein n=1 Tax=Jeotgalibacillus sp. JSM ZJ347 TaxID=3342117 RepID=UPI0035A8F04E